MTPKEFLNSKGYYGVEWKSNGFDTLHEGEVEGLLAEYAGLKKGTITNEKGRVIQKGRAKVDPARFLD